MPSARIPNVIGKRDACSWASSPSWGAMTSSNLRRRLKYLPMKTYYSLALPISKRLFRYLDKNRYNKSRYEEAVMKMAQKLPLNYTYPSQQYFGHFLSERG